MSAKKGPLTDAHPTLRIYNTLSKKKEPFRTVAPGKVGIYLCGPTVYDEAHIGHTETAAGIAGLIKVVLMLQHGTIPAQIHVNDLNPRITLAGSRLVIPREPLEWKVPGKRIAGISAFGFGGTNASLILGKYQNPS